MSTTLRLTFLTVLISNQLKPNKIIISTKTNKKFNVEMNNFKEISENVYRATKPSVNGATPCGCDRFYSNCESFCRNKCLLIECGACFFGNNCKNKRIQSKIYPKMLLKPAQSKGLGVFADENLMEDQFIVEYIGEVVSQQQLVGRMAKYERSKSKHSYIMSAKCETLTGKKTMIVDATKMGNISRFINHSCDPNCYVQIWETFGYNRIAVFAKQKIQKGEELTYNYGIQFFG